MKNKTLLALSEKDINHQRRLSASKMLAAYVEAKRQDGDRYNEEPLSAVVSDALADLRHYCAEERIDFEQAVLLSAIHFDIESESS